MLVSDNIFTFIFIISYRSDQKMNIL